MSHNYPYRRSPEGFSSHKGTFATSAHLHHEEHDIYQTSLQPSLRSTSIFTSSKSGLESYSSKSSTTAESALSLLSSCGLEPEDLSILAGMPENMITEKTLPRLLMEIRQKKALRDRDCPSSLRPSTCHPPLQPPSDTWKNSTNNSPVEYSANPSRCPSYPTIPPPRSSYPLPREETKSWQDRWGNPRQTGTVRQENTSSTYVVDYNYGQPQERDSQSLERPAYSTRAVGVTEQPKLQSSSHYRQLNPGKESAAPYQKKQVPPMTTTVHSTPTAREADDFHGATPQTFPYACSLCDIAVLSQKDWTLHINGAQHADSQLAVLQMYPDWDCRTGSARRSDCNSEKGREEKNTGGRRHGPPEHHGVTASREAKSHPASDKAGGRVVCAKYPSKSVDAAFLRRLVRQGGTPVNVMMFPVQAFVEMSSPDEAADVVKYFNRNPVVVEGRQIEFSMSATYNFLQNSPVVIFSLLSPGIEAYPEIVAIAKRFGTVKHSLFLPNRVLLEMESREDAGKLVQYYTSHPLKMKGKTIKVSHSENHSTLKFAMTDKKSEDGEASLYSSQSFRAQTRSSPSPRRRSPIQRRSPSPRRRSSSPRRSPNPRRRYPSPRRRSPSPRRRSPSPRRRSPSPRRRSPSPRRRSPSPIRRSPSPRRRSPSPRRTPNPRKRYPSPRRRSPSPRRRSPSPRQRSPSPRRRSPSPRRRSPSPRRRSPSPRRRSPSPRRRSSSPRRRSPIQRRRSSSYRRRSREKQDVDEDKTSQERTRSSRRHRNHSSGSSTSHTREGKSISRGHSVEKTADTQKAEVKGNAVLAETPDLGSSQEPLSTQTMENMPSPKEHPKDYDIGLKTQDQTVFEGGKDSDMDSDIEGMAVIGEDEEMRSEEGSVELQDEMKEIVCDEAGTERTSAEGLSTCPSEVAEDCEEEKQVETVGEELAMHPDQEPGSQSPTADPAMSEPSGLKAMEEEKQEESEEQEEYDFPESLENCITLDELEDEDEDEDDDSQTVASEGNSDQRSREEKREHDSGRVIYIQNLPRGYYTDRQFVAIGKKYGKVNRYFLIRRRKEGFIEMARAVDAQRAVRELKKEIVEMDRHILTVYLSRKYKRLTCGWSPESDSEDERGQRKHRKEKRRRGGTGEHSSKEEEKTTPAEPSSSIEAEEKATPAEPSSSIEAEEKPTPAEPSSSIKEEEEKTTLAEPSRSIEAEEKATPAEPSSSIEEEEEKTTPAEPSRGIEAEEKATPAEPSSSIEEEEEKAATEEPSSSRDQQQQEEEEKGSSETPCELAVAKENEDVKISQPSDSVDSQKETEGETSSENTDGIKQVCVEEEKMETIPEPSHVPLGPYLPNNPMGREFVSQKIGYFCSLCNAIYVTEDEARNEHCSSLSHYEKLKAYLEQNGNPN
ncbi:hypothetical protein SKAU_G00374240 [Synaphobranchus kaupii]|uniref:RRM domain-containing protein n=1 Tax=Synaphobranchus kaupii TaxID=118154 RepID=A0A9Q1IE53_SYNKA|nr:hypothetical protein SKAU_G00374240 [Synaphobranchus kaupii]